MKVSYNMNDCIFRVNNLTCRALTTKDCENCKFYKSKLKYKASFYIDKNGKKQRGVVRK